MIYKMGFHNNEYNFQNLVYPEKSFFYYRFNEIIQQKYDHWGNKKVEFDHYYFHDNKYDIEYPCVFRSYQNTEGYPKNDMKNPIKYDFCLNM